MEIFYVEESSNLIGWETFRSINEEQVLSFTCVFCRKFENYYYFYIQEKKSMHERIKFLIFFPNLGPYWELFESFWPAWIIFQKRPCVLWFYVFVTLCIKLEKLMSLSWDFALRADEKSQIHTFPLPWAS